MSTADRTSPRTPSRLGFLLGVLALATLVAGLALAGCGNRDEAGPQTPTTGNHESEQPEQPQQPEQPEQPPTTPDECRAVGGTFVASTGGAVQCPEGTREIAQIRFGIEGGLCCK